MNKMKLIVEVRTQGEFTSTHICMEIPDSLQLAFEPRKFCDDPSLAYALSEVEFGSPAAQKVLKLRKDAAEKLAVYLARLLVRSMQSKDTLNGYPVKIES